MASTIASPPEPTPAYIPAVWGQELARVFQRVAIFEVEGSAAHLVATQGLPAPAAAESIALSAQTPLRWAIDAGSPILGSGQGPGGPEMTRLLGITPPRAFAVLPIMRSGHLVALAYADQGNDPLPLASVSELFAQCDRLLRETQALGASGPTEEPAAVSDSPTGESSPTTITPPPPGARHTGATAGRRLTLVEPHRSPDHGAHPRAAAKPTASETGPSSAGGASQRPRAPCEGAPARNRSSQRNAANVMPALELPPPRSTDRQAQVSASPPVSEQPQTALPAQPHAAHFSDAHSGQGAREAQQPVATPAHAWPNTERVLRALDAEPDADESVQLGPSATAADSPTENSPQLVPQQPQRSGEVLPESESAAASPQPVAQQPSPAPQAAPPPPETAAPETQQPPHRPEAGRRAVAQSPATAPQPSGAVPERGEAQTPAQVGAATPEGAQSGQPRPEPKADGAPPDISLLGTAHDAAPWTPAGAPESAQHAGRAAEKPQAPDLSRDSDTSHAIVEASPWPEAPVPSAEAPLVATAAALARSVAEEDAPAEVASTAPTAPESSFAAPDGRQSPVASEAFNTEASLVPSEPAEAASGGSEEPLFGGLDPELLFAGVAAESAGITASTPPEAQPRNADTVAPPPPEQPHDPNRQRDSADLSPSHADHEVQAAPSPQQEQPPSNSPAWQDFFEAGPLIPGADQPHVQRPRTIGVVTPHGVVTTVGAPSDGGTRGSARAPARGWLARQRWIWLAAAMLIAFPVAGLALLLWSFSPNGAPGQSVKVHIPNSATVASIARQLAAENLIRHPSSFRLLARVTELDRSLKAGVYELPSGRWAWDVLEELHAGQVRTVRFTVPEGLTLEEVAQTVEAAGLVSASAFVRAASDHSLLAKYGIGAPTAEGFLFPETYTVAKGVRPRQIVETMLQQFFRKVREMPGVAELTPDQLLDKITLASIVEREARAPDEAKRIAGVFQNRLEQSMRLESCATVQYVLGEPKEHLTLEDVRTPSPYNTYLHTGLPPGPICNPGLPALEAALQPEQHDYLFFFAREDGTDRHVFSKTFSEHEAARRAHNP